MRVLYLTRCYSWHDQRFLHGIAMLGHEVALVSLRPSAAEQKRIGVPAGVVCLEALEEFGAISERAVVALRLRMNSFQPQIVHAGPLTDCAYLAIMAGTAPVVACSWAFDVLWEAAQDEVAATRAIAALRQCAGLLVDCATVGQRCQELSGRNFTQIAIFPWGVDSKTETSPSVRTLRRAELGWNEAVMVLSARNFEPLYDVGVLIRGFALAHQQDPRLRLVLLGDGSHRSALTALVDSLLLTEMVHFAGAVARPEVGDWFDAADIYASCARTDGSSVSLLEAMAHDLLPIASDLPSNREWIAPNLTGWLAACGDAQHFASALLEAASVAPGEKDRIIATNHRTIRERANWPDNLKRLQALYEDVAGQRGKSGVMAGRLQTKPGWVNPATLDSHHAR